MFKTRVPTNLARRDSVFAVTIIRSEKFAQKVEQEHTQNQQYFSDFSIFRTHNSKQ